MIQANELRIGNWIEKFTILGDSLGFCKVEAKDFLAMSNHPEWQSPIPLTEEILLKCGFVSDGVPVGYTIDNKFQVRHVYDNVAKNTWKWSFEAYDDDNWIGISEPQYLNQLQNLIFALTGKELEVEL